MKFKFLILACLCVGTNLSLFAQVNWVTETGFLLGTSFVNNDTIINIDGTGLDAVIKVNSVVSTDGFTEPRVDNTDPNVMYIRDADNASFTLEILNGTVDVRLENFKNLLRGELITISNPDGENIVITQTSGNGSGNIKVDGTALTGTLPASVIASSSTTVRGTGTSAGNFFNATMANVSEFTWRYDNVAGNSFTEGFYLFFSNPILPIELTQFSVLPLKNNSVKVDWHTASELNNDYFTLEKSSNGINWEEITKIDGAGNSTTLLKYFTVDDKPYLGTSYYRLKQTDFDGQFEYSQTKSVNMERQLEHQIEMYPNPVENQITLFGSSSELEEVIIYNMLGQDVTMLTSEIEKDNTKISIDMSSLKPGLYLIKTKTTTRKIHKK